MGREVDVCHPVHPVGCDGPDRVGEIGATVGQDVLGAEIERALLLAVTDDGDDGGACT